MAKLEALVQDKNSVLSRVSDCAAAPEFLPEHRRRGQYEAGARNWGHSCAVAQPAAEEHRCHAYRCAGRCLQVGLRLNSKRRSVLSHSHDFFRDSRLAFFQLNFQFYTTQQLQWEVVRHYSKQVTHPHLHKVKESAHYTLARSHQWRHSLTLQTLLLLWVNVLGY